jgi:hypothetical protein
MPYPSSASERRHRPRFPAALLPLVLLTALAAPALGQAPLVVSTSVSQNDGAAPEVTTLGLGAPG